MAYAIDMELCISCGACEAVCIEAARAASDGGGEAEPAVVFDGGRYGIDAGLCRECGECAKICPTSPKAASCKAKKKKAAK